MNENPAVPTPTKRHWTVPCRLGQANDTGALLVLNDVRGIDQLSGVLLTILGSPKNYGSPNWVYKINAHDTVVTRVDSWFEYVYQITNSENVTVNVPVRLAEQVITSMWYDAHLVLEWHELPDTAVIPIPAT